MTHPLFRTYPFIETAFARRFQAMLRSTRHNRAFHVIVADPGAGKTTSIRDMQKRAGGRSVLAVVAPKNNDDEQALPSSVLSRAVSRLWSVLAAGEHGPFLQVVECCASNRTRNGKRTLP